MVEAPRKRSAEKKKDLSPSIGQIEEMFWQAGLDLMVDGRRMYFGAEFVEMLVQTEHRSLVPLPGGEYRLFILGHEFHLGPWLEEVDGHRVRWVGKGQPPERPAAQPGAGRGESVAPDREKEDEDEDEDDE